MYVDNPFCFLKVKFNRTATISEMPLNASGM